MVRACLPTNVALGTFAFRGTPLPAAALLSLLKTRPAGPGVKRSQCAGRRPPLQFRGMHLGLRRVVALIVSAFLLQLVFVGAGFACGTSATAAGHGATGSMAGMVMPGQAPSSASTAEAPDGAVAPAPASEPSPCHFPWAPNGCRDMAPCAPAAMPTPPVGETAPAAPPILHARVRAGMVRTPPSVLTAPEPPPPRA